MIGRISVMDSKTPRYVWDFIEAICPEGPNLYLSLFNERRCLQDATQLIRELRTRIKELEQIIKERKNEIQR